jgi:hypothetical protein
MGLKRKDGFRQDAVPKEDLSPAQEKGRLWAREPSLERGKGGLRKATQFFAGQ